MTLHQAIEKTLQQKKRHMTTQQIADELNKNDLYHKKDGSAITAFQIHGRTRKYPKIFNRDGSTVSLNEQPTAKPVTTKMEKPKQVIKATKVLTEDASGNKKGIKKTAELLSDLEKYEKKGKFHFSINDVLSLVCNIPKRNDYSGLYLFYSQDKELIYVGISGREGSGGNIIHRQDGLRGRFLTGKQFGDRRSKTLPIQMKLDSISSLEIHWFITYGDGARDIPRPIERTIIEAFKMEHDGKRPNWNKKD